MKALRRPTRRELLTSSLCAPWAAWALVRCAGLDLGHPLVAAMAATPYVAACSPLPVVVALALRTWAPAAVAAASALALGAAVLPRTLDGPQHAAAGEPGLRLTVMTVNLLGAAGDPGTVVRMVRERRVDVLSVQELTPEALAGLDRAGLRALLPGRVLEPRGGASGSGLMARRSLRRVTVVPPPALRGVGHAQPEASLRLADGRRLRLKAVHPIPPRDAAATGVWRRQLRAMPAPRAGAAPQLLLGDFNATLDQRELRRLLHRGYYDAADATGDGLRATWPVGRTLPGITIDHVLLPSPLKVRSVRVREVPGSDHRAVIAELLLPPRRVSRAG